MAVRITGVGIFKVSYLDACAAVKLDISERGSDHLRGYFARHSFSITSFCLFEAFGVLKRKMLNDEIPREQYFFACYVLIAYLRGRRIRIDDQPEIDSIETFSRAEKLTAFLELESAVEPLAIEIHRTPAATFPAPHYHRRQSDSCWSRL